MTATSSAVLSIPVPSSTDEFGLLGVGTGIHAHDLQKD